MPSTGDGIFHMTSPLARFSTIQGTREPRRNPLEMCLFIEKIIIIISVAAVCVSDVGRAYMLEDARGGQRIIIWGQFSLTLLFACLFVL